jgi:hypothetical protein
LIIFYVQTNRKSLNLDSTIFTNVHLEQQNVFKRMFHRKTEYNRNYITNENKLNINQNLELIRVEIRWLLLVLVFKPTLDILYGVYLLP